MLQKFCIQAHSQSKLPISGVRGRGVAATETAWVEFTAVLAAVVFLNSSVSIGSDLLVRIQGLDIKTLKLVDLVPVKFFQLLLAQKLSVNYLRDAEDSLVRQQCHIEIKWLLI